MSAPTDEPGLDLDDIQGNAVPGFLKNNQHFMFFNIVDASAARKTLNRLGSLLASAREILEAHKEWRQIREKLGHEPDSPQYLFRNLALSARGLRKLTSDADVDQFADEAFKEGLSAARSAYIGDTAVKSEPGHASGWIVGGSAHPVDGVLIMASDDLSLLTKEIKKLSADFTAHGMSIVHEDQGDVNAAPQAGHEQFGFKDGISQPAIRGRWPKAPYDFVISRTIPGDKAFDQVRADFASPGCPLVWPGHFLFGYARQQCIDARTRDDSNKPVGPAWAKNGSLMVYRRLRQHTDEFWRFVAKTSQALSKKYPKEAPDKQRLASLLIGRWPSGTPLVRSPSTDTGITGAGLNYFSYAIKQAPPLPTDSASNAADPAGLLCPVGAHIRKVNPRDQATDLGLADRTTAHSILRRGLTYDAKGGDKGLIFVAYQTSIVGQFEFLMKQWIAKRDAPRHHGGHDPILSQGVGRVFYLPIADKVEEIVLSNTFVVPTGGEYFFSPSIDFFKTTIVTS
jgi:Dyp-type peroxidase family